MMKPSLEKVLFPALLMAAFTGHAVADEQPAAKILIAAANNPQRIEAPADPEATPQVKAVTKYIGNGDTVGVYDVWFDMQTDNDGDGYYSKFKLNFDIDSRYNNHRIYVTGHLNNEASTPLFRTDPFSISGETGNDTYSATVLLTEGYPSSQYDLTLRIYDAQTNSLLLTWGPVQDGRMSQLFLEDSARDAVSSADVQVFELAYTLRDDRDGDGYFTSADVRIDVDAPYQSRSIYASLFLIDHHNNWIPLLDSTTTNINGFSNTDALRVDFVLDSGFDPQRYRLGAQIYDAWNHNLLVTATSPESTPLHMESIEYDTNGYYDDHHSRSGGATGIVLLAGLALLWNQRRRQR